MPIRGAQAWQLELGLGPAVTVSAAHGCLRIGMLVGRSSNEGLVCDTRKRASPAARDALKAAQAVVPHMMLTALGSEGTHASKSEATHAKFNGETTNH